MADSIGGDMIRGHIDSIILNSLLDGDKDTNQIRTEIENKAGGDFKLKQGTFYSALQRISKQGFVTEYRTSGSDGVRRKFFQLTEKGKAHIEKSQSTWCQSQNVINKLLDAEQAEVPVRFSSVPQFDDIKIPPFEDQPIVTDFSELTNPLDEQPEDSNILYCEENDNLSSVELPVEEEKTAVSPSDSDVNGLLNILDSDLSVEKNDNMGIVDDEPVSVCTYTYFDHSDVKENEAPPIDSGSRNAESTFSGNSTQPDKNSFESIVYSTDEYEPEYNCDISTDLFSKNNQNKTVIYEDEPERVVVAEDDLQTNIQQSTDSSDTNLSPSDELNETKNTVLFDDLAAHDSSKTKYEQLSLDTSNLSDKVTSTTSINTSKDEIDDFVTNPDDLPEDKYPDQPSYKDILARIIEKKKPKEQPVADKKKQDEPVKVLEFPKIDVEEPGVNEIDSVESNVIVDNLDFVNQPQPTETDNKENKESKEPAKTTLKPKNGFDYSDIISLSEQEGFKISTSDKTNKSELGKILLNKLNFHSSVLFFVLICLETLLVGLTMNTVLDFPIYSYFLFGLAVFILPLVSGVIYYISPKRAVAEVRPFKSAFETALIITLELLIAILMVTVIRNLDFGNYAEVARSLFIPLLIVINVPIYVIIKYSLLDKQQYFS